MNGVHLNQKKKKGKKPTKTRNDNKKPTSNKKVKWTNKKKINEMVSSVVAGELASLSSDGSLNAKRDSKHESSDDEPEESAKTYLLSLVKADAKPPAKPAVTLQSILKRDKKGST
ncbi:hypothetical protein ACA910_011636 [Epithemia clementina (nom. ined.)]